MITEETVYLILNSLETIIGIAKHNIKIRITNVNAIYLKNLSNVFNIFIISTLFYYFLKDATIPDILFLIYLMIVIFDLLYKK